MWRVGEKWIALSSVLKQMAGKLQERPTDARGFSGASFTDLDGIILMRL